MKRLCFVLLMTLVLVSLPGAGQASGPLLEHDAGTRNGGPWSASSDVPVARALSPRVAYIYASDTASRDSFLALLTSRGYAVDLVSLSGAETFDFSSVEAIIIGDDTGFHYSWGTPAAVSNVSGAGKPILGVGEGGTSFFHAVGLSIGWGHGMYTTGDGVYVLDAAHPIWSFPNDIGATTGSVVTLYTTEVRLLGIYAPSPGTGVTRIASHPTHRGYYPLISETRGAQCYFLWGFTASPAKMTATGQDLFINAVSGEACLTPGVGPLEYRTHVVDDDTEGESVGNDDGVVNCGEVIELHVDLRNRGLDAAEGVTATISTSDPYVSWLDNTSSSYPTVPGASTERNDDAFEFEVHPATPDGHVIHFDLEITASNGGPWSASFDVPVVCALPARVAYIHDWDTASRDSFSTLLTSRGLAVDPVPLSGAETFDFASHVAIIIGNDTGVTSWGTPAAVGNVNAAGKPIVGIGDGGAAFFDAVGLYIGWPQGMHTTGDAVVALDGANPIWTAPNDTGATAGSAVTLYTTTVPLVQIYTPPSMMGVTRIGRHPDYGGYCPLSAEMGTTQCYLLWGFTGSPEGMTATGQDLLINALYGQACAAPGVGPLAYETHVVDDDTSGESNGNGDGIVNCGEIIELYVDLRNAGTDTAEDVNASITTSDPYVTWLDNTSSSYPMLLGAGTGRNSDDFEFTVDSATPDGHVIRFDLDIHAANGGPWSASFDVPVACPAVPDIHVTPGSLGATLPEGKVISRTVVISNTGRETLTYDIVEHSWGSPGMGQSEIELQQDAPWLSVAPTSGSVAAGDSQDVIVTLDTTGLSEGRRRCNLKINNNDPDENPVNVLVTLWVVGDPHEPNDDPAEAAAINCGDVISATIAPYDDVDYYSFGSSAGLAVVADIDASIHGSRLDSVLTLLDSDGVTVLAENDDSGWTTDSHIECLLPHDGTFYLRVLDLDLLAGGPRYFYTLTLRCDPPPDIDVWPQQFDVMLSSTQAIERPMTIRNTGQSPLQFWIGKALDSGVAQSEPLVIRVPASTPVAAGEAELGPQRGTLKEEGSREFVIEGASLLADGCADVLLLYADYFSSQLRTFLRGFPDIRTVDTLYADETIPALPDLLPYDVVIAWNNLPWADPDLIGDVLADYHDAGGNVILAVDCWSAGVYRTGGRFFTEQYSPFSSLGSALFNWVALGWYDAGHPLMDRVEWTVAEPHNQVEMNPGAELVAEWDDGMPFIATKETGGRQTVAINTYYADDQLAWYTDAPLIVHNAIVYLLTAGGVPWLSVEPRSGTVNPDESQEIAVTFDPARLAVGDYSANLVIFNNDPDEDPVNVPAALLFDHPPQVGTVAPSSGSAPAGVTRYFTTTWSDPDGWEDLKQCYFHIGASSSLVDNVTLMYDVTHDKLWIRSDDGSTWLGGYAPWSDNIIENRQAKVYCALTRNEVSGDTVSVRWAIRFKPDFRGVKKTGLKCRDIHKLKAKGVWKGTWNIY